MGKQLNDLQPPSFDEVSKLIRNMPAKSSVMDSIHTSVLKQVRTVNRSSSRALVLQGMFPLQFKVASITP